jgi:hypothetical protein
MGIFPKNARLSYPPRAVSSMSNRRGGFPALSREIHDRSAPRLSSLAGAMGN